MLDYERLTSGRLVFVQTPFHLSKLFHGARATFAGVARKKGVAVVFEELAPVLVGVCFVGDYRRLQQCVNNGFSNALKFTDSGGTITMRAWLAPREPGAPLARVHVAITDSGVGLDEVEQRELHEGARDGGHFVQVGQGKLQGNTGTGLGLGITRQILALHNGSTLRIHSAGTGRGTTFELQVNLGLDTDSPREVEESAGCDRGDPAASSSGALIAKELRAHPMRANWDSHLQFHDGFRVLHVEDDRILRKSFEARIFRKLSVPVDQAVNGQQALDWLLTEQRAYALVLMDNLMPVLSGEAATRKLREAGYTGAIVGMTGALPAAARPLRSLLFALGGRWEGICCSRAPPRARRRAA
jgi:CheY-like chemotaxis protein